MSYQKVRQHKISDTIEHRLEQLILNGEIRCGEQLMPERELARTLSVSRSSLREAIKRLETKGLLYSRHGEGTFVQSTLWKSLSEPIPGLLATHIESQFDILEARHWLEGVAAYYAASRGSDEEIQTIQQKYQQLDALPAECNIDVRVTAVIEYQLAITEAAHNVILLHLLYNITPILQQSMKKIFEQLYARREAFEQVKSHRSVIVKAILDREPEMAREASYQHLSFISEILVEISDVDPNFFFSKEQKKPRITRPNPIEIKKKKTEDMI